jgi:hypothetical protein
MPASPTYRTETSPDGQVTYYCLYCEGQGQEHHSSDKELFEQHMHQRHDGRMEEETPAVAGAQRASHPDHPHGGPPGQTGEHPQGGPPGQTGEHPEEPEVPAEPPQPAQLPAEPAEGT